MAAGHYTDTLTLPSGLALLGGYASQAGYTVRQPWQYPTHLHGSGPAAAAVLTITGTQVLVDGFFFQGGPSQPDTAIRVSPAVMTATTVLGHLAVDGFVYGVDASASAAIEYSLFTDNQIGVCYVDAPGWVYKSTFVEQSQQAVYVYHSDAPLPDPVVLVQDSILVNNAVALAGLPATGEVTVTGVNLLFWGNQTKLSGDAESKNDLNADPLFANPWQEDYHLYAASPAAYRGGDTYHLGAFGLVPNTTAEVTLSIEAYAPTADPPVVCPVMVELATGNMVTADVNENGQADDCFVGEYDAPLSLPMPTHPTAPYGWYGAYVTFPTDAPDYEGPADQGGIWGYWWFNADANGHFLHIWPFWSAGARQTAAAVVPGSQGQGAARTEPRLYTNVPPRLLPVETQHVASLPTRPPQPATIIHTPPVLEDTATIAYTRQRATLTLASMTIAVHITDTSAPDELVYVFADHASTGSAQVLGSASILADESGDPIPNSAARYYPFGDWRTEPTAADETSRWYTGHVHNNLSHNNLGLIYMNARFYLPGVARFLSADTLVPDPTNPKSFNRYVYGYNNPLRYIDLTGHCSFDSNGEINRFNCSLDEFDAMPIAERERWMRQFMRQVEGAENWFNNIVGIIEGFVEYGLANSGSWLSIVDAGILQGIRDGYTLSNGTATYSTNNPGSRLWKDFFDALGNDTSDSNLINLWGLAEQAATNFGIEEAARKGLSPNGYEQIFLQTGNVYRSAAAAFEGGLGTPLSWLGAALGVFSGAGEALLSLSVTPIYDMGEFGMVAGYQLGSFFNDPRSLWNGHSPVYWYSTTYIWAKQETRQ